MSIDYSLYLIVDHTQLNTLQEVLDHGVTCVQLRMKNQALENILSIAKQLKLLLKARNIPLIINDHIEIAKAIDADGVHIGQQDQSYVWARQQLGYKKIIGVSIQNTQQAEHCQSFDCDYFGVGPIFATTTKTDASPPIGIENLKKITTLLPKPIVAIGGIHADNIHTVLTTPVAGIAVAAAVFSAHSPKQATQNLSSHISRTFPYAKRS
ncbi:thiamine phosphate synthase [Rickettsiella endosymbiont of Dermanyssus gallinae]|uniref:thiamine phosphate synthase n=1 Tax=Rickettsiella endosymbiont of Dermanyssus gallinae TaxID=2856608 RepID=UPI001C5319E1|nr:thiamine phosphate synthase [Rickettsiella endosymbiont of Dermanyssus gallinae]